MKDLINRIREWFTLRKRVRKLEEEMSELTDTLKTFMELSIPVFRTVVSGSPQADELEEILKKLEDKKKKGTDTD